MTSKIWYSYQGGISEDDDIGFYNPKQIVSLLVIEKNWKEIAKEIQDYLQNNRKKLSPYFDPSLVNQQKSWKIATFIAWNWNKYSNIKSCPKTLKILSEFPDLVSASISVLEPGATIKPHRGDTNAIIRCHLPLQASEKLPLCGMKVKYEERSWINGKLLAFNDAAWHTAWNKSEKRRIILIFDIIKPEFSHKKYTICSKVLTSIFVNGLLHKFGKNQSFNKKMKHYFITSFALIINCLLRINNIFK
ncbi:aspartyl/asparaginyl beta-hydroxylase domain-containing protein [Mesonia aquimarina]|uniref:aspartyl/asparaginyl beta-hydroxylase domain-containing protein n=1 Tax=Mesonia aquimarina TaxID=1504967 RepID=UPI0013CF1E77|nr:aspartyl/asparaginyl beta-hydroxylase domain-containing protein [Mesonia aquimarina]